MRIKGEFCLSSSPFLKMNSELGRGVAHPFLHFLFCVYMQVLHAVLSTHCIACFVRTCVRVKYVSYYVLSTHRIMCFVLHQVRTCACCVKYALTYVFCTASSTCYVYVLSTSRITCFVCTCVRVCVLLVVYLY